MNIPIVIINNLTLFSSAQDFHSLYLDVCDLDIVFNDLTFCIAGRNYSLYFTGSSPQHLRLMMLNTPNKDRIRVGAYNSKPNRLDVYVNGDYKLPKNGQLDSNKNLILQQATSVGEFNPKVDSDPCGTNYMDRDWQELQVIVCGGDEVEIKMSPQIVVGFNVPTMTVDQFFGPNLLNNLATFLGISSDKIRTMQVQSGVSRRKRSTGTNTMYYIEVGNPPCTDINCTSAVSVMTYTDQQALASKIINQYQVGASIRFKSQKKSQSYCYIRGRNIC